MKKWFVALLVLLAVIVLISPAIVGRLTERDISKSIEIANVESPDVSIQTERFERRWFSSEGRHRIELSDRDAFPSISKFTADSGYDGLPAVVIDTRIDHGLVPAGSVVPGIANIASTFQLDPGNGKLVDLPARVQSTISLTGLTDGTVEVDTGEWHAGSNEINWQGADLKFSLDRAGILSTLSGHVGPMEFSADSLHVETSTLNIAFDQTGGPYSLVLPTLKLGSGAMNAYFGGSNIERSGLSEFQIELVSDVVRGKLLGNIAIDIDDLAMLTGEKFDINVVASTSGIDAKRFADLYHAYSAYLREGHNSKSALQALYSGNTESLLALLQAGIELDIESARVGSPQGMFAGDLSVTLPASDSDEPVSWSGLLLKLHGTMNFSMPEALFEQLASADPQLNMAVATGFLVAEDEQYVMHVDIAKGVAKVNGAPIPLSGF